MFRQNKDDPLVEQLRKFKAPQDVLDIAIADASPLIEIWPENWDVFQFFLRLMTQWHMLALPGKMLRVGLKYESVEAMMRIDRIQNRAQFFDDVQTMEFSALQVFNEAL